MTPANHSHNAIKPPMVTRRGLLKSSIPIAGALIASDGIASGSSGRSGQSPVLKESAHRGGRLIATFSGQHELMKDPIASSIIASEFDMIAIGNDLKMNRLRPTPETYDFSYGDYDLAWSKRHGLLFRGHTLVWHNALPSWFVSYVNHGNAKQVMTDHITTVMKRYAGEIYSWDVVNEVIRTTDRRPDGLRAWPWLRPIGPDYIDIAFHTAAEADPKAKLILNENNFEHEMPSHAERREALLQLLTRLKRNKVPITGLGTQGHIRADTPFATGPVKDFFKACQDLGLETMITELDVDDGGIDGPHADAAVAGKYAEYLDLVGPFASVITLEALADHPDKPGRPDGQPHRANLWDMNHERKPAYSAAAKSLSRLPGRKASERES